MKRRRMFPNTDRRVFRSTADRIKSINIRPMVMRGGIRL